MKTSDFDYELPQELIAQTPIEPRDHSRLMVLSRSDGAIQHRRFFDLPEFLRPDDLLVFNDSRVMPARLHGTRVGTGAKVELLLLHRTSDGLWRSLVRPGRRLRPGDAFEVSSGLRRITGEIVDVEGDGARLVRIAGEEHLQELGVVPLPPYIHSPLEDAERYQTVYARALGSVAAPTAGLHFTPDLLDRVRSVGAELAFVTLHVGWDSFRPVRNEDVASHEMHREYYEITAETAESVNAAKNNGRRVISVGTTAVRVLEHAALELRGAASGTISPGSAWADLFVYPGFRFRVIDALVTNFHLPRSTLLMLTSAFTGRDRVLAAYAEAASNGYRFYSFGDAMLIV